MIYSGDKCDRTKDNLNNEVIANQIYLFKNVSKCNTELCHAHNVTFLQVE
jgi:hypothetical protein